MTRKTSLTLVLLVLARLRTLRRAADGASHPSDQ